MSPVTRKPECKENPTLVDNRNDEIGEKCAADKEEADWPHTNQAKSSNDGDKDDTQKNMKVDNSSQTNDYDDDNGDKKSNDDKDNPDGCQCCSKLKRRKAIMKTVGIGLGVGVGSTVVGIIAAPLVITAAGFTSAGIVGGSIAASMMSTAWTTGIGVGIVSTLQSVGAAGLGAAGFAAVGATAGTVGGTSAAGISAIVGKCKCPCHDKKEK